MNTTIYMNRTIWTLQFIWTEQYEHYTLYEQNDMNSTFYMNRTIWTLHFIGTEQYEHYTLTLPKVFIATHDTSDFSLACNFWHSKKKNARKVSQLTITSQLRTKLNMPPDIYNIYYRMFAQRFVR